MNAFRLAIDLVDDFEDNIDGDPAVEEATVIDGSNRHSRVRVKFTDETEFIIEIAQVTV